MDGKNDSESMKPDDADALGSDAFPDDADDFFGAVAAEAGALVSEKIGAKSARRRSASWRLSNTKRTRTGRTRSRA